ncbi:hypothetical protein [Prolixibacter sp. SD074]|jgi:hypothetical protein|uniref:hypothetical protein n=1 Tax=Prolixibacter sp. SD074 TaxID=2652391 RepID=UPI00128668EF|nr:hypothetical protein [Prolixibacter sp. SD074]GET30776.1 hypothetical protein SD074_29780 [Prolixibacter sp. SD074]
MNRKFNYSDLSMLVAALTLTGHFEQEKEALVAEQPLWADPFIASFRENIQQILTTVHGINTRKNLRNATTQVNQLLVDARDDLVMIKTQIERGYRTDPGGREDLLKWLGYADLWPAAHLNQSEGIDLVITFRNNLTEELRTDMEAHGVNADRLDRIIGYADTLNQANVTQESLKGSTRLDTVQLVTKLNAVYAQAMDIGAIGKQLFKNDKAKRDLFVFSKLVRMQGSKGSSSSESDESNSPEA